MEIYKKKKKPFGKICVHRRLFEVNFMVTCDGSNGLIRARDSKGGEPSDPITMRNGGERSLSNEAVTFFLFNLDQICNL